MAARDDAFRRPASAAVGRTTAHNHLLEALSQDDWILIEPCLERVQLGVADRCEHAGENGGWLYFPETAIISVLSTMVDGRSIEVGTIGNEGMSGLPAYLGADTTAGLSSCRVAGAALRVQATALIALAAQRPALQRLLGRYTGAYLVLTAQGTACNHMHGLEQRCARWLLMTHDRIEGDFLPVTREFMGLMLGVSRAGASLAVSALRQHGLVRSNRTGITILDRPGLEFASCECYAIVRKHFDRIS